MPAKKALVVRLLGALTAHRKSASWQLVCHLNTSPPFLPSWVRATSKFLPSTKKIGVLSKLYSSQNLKVFRKVENRS